MESSKRSAALLGFILIIAAILGGIFGPSLRATAAGDDELQNSVATFARVLAIVQHNYADPIDTNKIVFDGAIPGMLRVLDPHSTFWDPKAFALLMEQQRGNYFGVGMRVNQQGDNTVVVSPFPGAPADRAGIKPGDVIEKVDGKECEGLTTTQVADLLKGPRGTVVTITLGREGVAKPIEVNVERGEIPQPAVEYSTLIKPGIGYVRVSTFSAETTDSELQAALQKMNYPHLDGLIIDLRGNGGGLLMQAVGMADMFLAKGQLVVSHKGRASPEQKYYAVNGNDGVHVPIVVLINGMTASASEIVSGALQDHDRALILGTLSFGKGLVQTQIPLSDGTMLLLTTAHYYMPSGRLIQRNYKDISIYDYEYDPQRPKSPEVSYTDSGRKVYGGGGITPDVVYPAPKPDPFQQLLFARNVFYPSDPYFATSDPVGVGDFTLYLMSKHPDVTRQFTVDDAVMKEFESFLTKQNIQFTPEQIQNNQSWIEDHIKREVFTYALGLDAGYRVAFGDDPQVQKAVDEIPQAKALYENAQKIMAERRAGQLPPIP